MSERDPFEREWQPPKPPPEVYPEDLAAEPCVDGYDPAAEAKPEVPHADADTLAKATQLARIGVSIEAVTWLLGTNAPDIREAHSRGRALLELDLCCVLHEQAEAGSINAACILGKVALGPRWARLGALPCETTMKGRKI